MHHETMFELRNTTRGRVTKYVDDTTVALGGRKSKQQGNVRCMIDFIYKIGICEYTVSVSAVKID
jgi:hypothetical protein